MRVFQDAYRFIHRTAVGALLPFDATVVLAILAITVSFYTHDPQSLIFREPLLIWLPFALAALATIILTLAAVLRGAVNATRRRRGWWATSFRVLAPLLIAGQNHHPPLLSISSSLEALLGIIAGAAYLALPVMALIYLRRRPAAPSPLGGPGVRTSL